MTDPLALDNQLCFALYNASRAVVRAYGPLLEPLGLTYPQYIALLALWQEDDVSVTQLGERLGLDSATLTPLLKRIETRGLVERKRDDADERVVRIRLTKAGNALRTQAKKIPAQIAARAGFSGQTSLTALCALRDELTDLTARLEQSPRARRRA